MAWQDRIRDALVACTKGNLFRTHPSSQGWTYPSMPVWHKTFCAENGVIFCGASCLLESAVQIELLSDLGNE